MAAGGGRARHAGVLAHPMSLPGPGPIGELGPYALAFLEWMSLSGLDTWQVLPLHPVGGGYSPYASPSAFAADPRLVSVEGLIADGWVERQALPWGQDRVDHALVESWKIPLVRAAGARAAGTAECTAWAREQGWLGDWTRFAALARAHGRPWWEWISRAEAAPEIEAEERGMQWLFAVQWGRVRDEARARGIRIVGDVPIFVAADSSDCMAHPELFQWRAPGVPDPVSGVPADYFSPMGQRWANPMHDWQAHARGKYRWWKARMRRELDLVDAVRLDHFRGFCAAWAIPADEPDARKGAWVEGPGAKLFAALRKDLGSLPCWAEDLGEITPDVEGLRDGLDLPGMKILQFAFGGGGEHPFLPHNYAGTRWVAYTGTHDNDTAVGWYATADEESRHRFRVYTGRDGSDPAWSLIRESFASVAETAIAPLQDFLRLGSEARMNTPGTVEGNWSWRAREIPWDACGWIRGMVEATGRG